MGTSSWADPGFVEETAPESSRSSPARARGLAEQAEEVRVEVNTNRGGDAPVNARALREALGQGPGPPVPPRAPAG